MDADTPRLNRSRSLHSFYAHCLMASSSSKRDARDAWDYGSGSEPDDWDIDVILGQYLVTVSAMGPHSEHGFSRHGTCCMVMEHALWL